MPYIIVSFIDYMDNIKIDLRETGWDGTGWIDLSGGLL
jgi:hypothetical protein